MAQIFLFTCFFSAFLIKYKFRSQLDKKFLYNPISAALLILLAFYIIQVLNPNMFSKLGWFSYTRKYFLQLCFFASCYCLFDTWKKAKSFIYFWIIFSTILAAYACKQQWFGLADFEWNWLNSHTRVFDLFLQWGLLRKFSILSIRPPQAYYFASISTLCIILIIREKKIKTRFWLSVAAIFNLLAYAFSGTRTATLMIVAGIAFYFIATMKERRTIIFAVLMHHRFSNSYVHAFQPAGSRAYTLYIPGIKRSFSSNQGY